MIVIKPIDICQVYGAGLFKDLAKGLGVDQALVCFDAYSRCTPIIGKPFCSPSGKPWYCCNDHCIKDKGNPAGGRCVPVHNTCPEFFLGNTMMQCVCNEKKDL